MIIEGRTITTLEELKDFCDAAIRQAKIDPAQVRLSKPVALRLHQHGDITSPPLAAYDVEVL
jgi:hypothetical protein